MTLTDEDIAGQKDGLGVLARDGEITLSRERGQIDKRYIYWVVRDGDQVLFEIPSSMDRGGIGGRASTFYQGYRMACAVYKPERIRA